MVKRVLAMLAMLGTLGCSPVEVGPIQVVINGGEAELPPVGLGFKGDLPPVNIVQPFCDLPSEADLTERIRSIGGFDVSRFARIRGVELAETRFIAVDGDFSFADSASIRLTPVAGDTFLLGEASAPEGFGDAIVLTPVETVQLLDIIRANDEAPSDLCPLLEARFTIGQLVMPNVRFRIEVVLDAYVELGVFGCR